MKTRSLKQKEAIERKLRHVDRRRQQYLESLRGTNLYDVMESTGGTEYADLWHKERKLRFERLCAECGIDTHGNPLEK